MSKATEELLNALHGALASDLMKKIKEGTASAAELSTAVRFLKDNGITSLPGAGGPTDALADEMAKAQVPFDEDGIEDVFKGAPHGRA